MSKNNKLGFQAPKYYVIDLFRKIEVLDDSLVYSKAGNFVYDKYAEEFKLHNAQPCFHTDSRYNNRLDLTTSGFTSLCHDTIFDSDDKFKSKKSCVRKVNKIANIPSGTIVKFYSPYRFKKRIIDGSFLYKVKKSKKVEIDYVNDIFVGNFTSCQRSIELTNKLRDNGFIVRVDVHKRRLYKDSDSDEYDIIDEEYAVAYGNGKVIGFSANNGYHIGYWHGEDSVLWDFYGCFDKWSKCEKIPKNTPLDKIIEILKSERSEEG